MTELSQQISQLRRDYVSQPFDQSHVAVDPFDQFKRWFEEALQAEQPDVEAMTLSTAADGRVSGRIVLLKGFDARGGLFESIALRGRQRIVSSLEIGFRNRSRLKVE